MLFSSALTFVGGVIGSVVVKYSLYKGLNSKSNSYSDGASVSARGETFGTSFELVGPELSWSDAISIHQNAWIPFLLYLIKIFTISGYVARATKDVKVFDRRFSVIDDVIWCLFVFGDN
ncbi:hypothetical protein Tco_0799898 [Tanacetum coccineum]|uniref:Uncharacterized protein n=1 Tax=Tanacetum coccineum TaxID=301880 RepID=A0ABQ4ZSM7_9ASTR